MGKQPYIPLYIGDWEQDTNTISLEAEGALVKLVFKLWNSKEKGKLIISFNQLSILLKKSQENALKIIQELKENEVLNIEIFPEGIINIESRRMLKEASKSKSLSDNGKKGGRKKKQIESKSKAKSKQIPEYENEYDNETETKNFKMPEPKKFDLVFPYGSEEFMLAWQAWVKYRQDILKPYHTMSSAQTELEGLSKHGEEKAIYLIKTALRNGWKNITDDGKFTGDNLRKQTTNDKRASVNALVASIRESDSRNNSPYRTGSD